METNNSTIEVMSTKEQKKAKGASKFVRVIPANQYSPDPKPLSKRDQWRLDVASRKQGK